MHASAGLLALGIETDVEVGAVDEAASLARARRSSADCSESIASGFSQTTCLPASSAASRLCVVELVRRRQVNDVDAIVVEQRLEAVVRLGAGPPALGARPLRRGADDAGDLHAEPAQCVDVHDADEAGAHHRRTQIRQVTHRMPIVRGRAPRL